MAMTLPIIIPPTPSAGSPGSDDSSIPPRTPGSPNHMQPLSLPRLDQAAAQAGLASQHPSSLQMKRKPSRRANTAERRATHNAVERQRRETLNSRFLDLAALLPNLSQIRRPSKSSIVNSSIAHIHASRRHRLLASRELRLVKLESDALRRELNEWRDRAGLPRVEEPVRGEGFGMVLSGEVEVLAINEDDEDCDEYGEEDYAPRHVVDEGAEEMRQAAASMLQNANANPFAHNLPSQSNNGMQLPHILPRPTQQGGPMIAQNQSAVSYENPAMASLYEPHSQGFQSYMQVPQVPEMDKVAAWNAQLYALNTNGQQMQAQRTLFTPPQSSGGLNGSVPGSTAGQAPNPFSDPASQTFFANFQRQQQQQLAAMQNGQMYGSPDRDDLSSNGSGSIRGTRQRSGSASQGSGYGSPSETAGSFEMPSSMADYSTRRLSGHGLQINTGFPGQNAGSPIAIGGGGNGTGFAMMM